MARTYLHIVCYIFVLAFLSVGTNVVPMQKFRLEKSKPIKGKPIKGKPIKGKPIKGKPIKGKPIKGKPEKECSSCERCGRRRIKVEKIGFKNGKAEAMLRDVVMKKHVNIYSIRATANQTIKFSTSAPENENALRVKFYYMDSPKLIASNVKEWEGKLYYNGEYNLTVSNCLGNTNIKYKIKISLR